MSRAAAILGRGRQRIAVVGTGISGLLCAERLATEHDITVFEASSRIGGHTHTVDVEQDGGTVSIDTGFIVCNDRTYPEFLALLSRLGVGLRPSTMSFSVRSDPANLEYCGSSIGQLFAQRRNLVRPAFWSMLRGMLRFHRQAGSYADSDLTLADVLREGCFGDSFARWYLVPMMAAIWSAEPERLMSMPARFFVRFFANHGMLQVRDRPLWFTVEGGSRSYLGPLTGSFAHRIRLAAPVVEVRRGGGGVTVRVQGKQPERFDAVVLATHSNQSRRMLADATAEERSMLAAIPYQENRITLHTDTRMLPRRRKAWAAWNYHLQPGGGGRATLTYNMNILQGLANDTQFLVTLNSEHAIDESKVLGQFVYHHPVFDLAGVAAQDRVPEVNGSGRVWFCGAWCGYGFHEDGVRSALRVAADFGISNGAAERFVMAEARS